MPEAQRLLPVESLPDCLWDDSLAVLHLPPELKTVFVAEVARLGLAAEASAMDSDGPTGGKTEAETHLHFAQRFTGSCGRVELAALDPKTQLLNASDKIVAALAGGKVALLDIPCGAGAGTLSLLATISTLRREARLPALPLDVHLLGGDISQPALDVAARLLDEMRPSLAEQSIYVHSSFQIWDVHNKASTVSLLNQWTTGTGDARIHFVAATNFSAFLGNDGNFKKAKPQLEDILLWAGAKRSQLVWIEPQTNIAKAFLSKLLDKLKEALRWLSLWKTATVEGPFALTECSQQHAIATDRQFPVRLALMLFDHSEQSQ